MCWAIGLSLCVGVMPVQAAPAVQLREADVPLDVEGPAERETDTEAKVELVESSAEPVGPVEVAASEASEASAESRPPPPRIDPRDVPLQVAVGLGPTAPGSRDELSLVDALEGSASSSAAPQTTVRRIQGGAGEPRSVCRQRRDDLVLAIAYIPEFNDPVILAYDCALDRALGTRAVTAVTQVGLIGALWAEHEELLRSGVEARRAPLVSRRTRRILIVGGAVAVLGVALGLILASTLRPSTVVLTVGQ